MEAISLPFRSTPMASIINLIAIRIFSKRSPSTTPLESQSAPVDWVWSALDIAEQAAMAEDLAQVPSIAKIASIFSQMLERLQVSGFFLRLWPFLFSIGDEKQQERLLRRHE